ncbi:MAG TPA: carbohydrate ABC transporter permease, partial [Clostridiales bacterium]|nr:carbohydrate ABC transporter permease [Clostridiales bacterium]
MTERTERLVLPNEILQRRERRKIRAANAARSFVVNVFRYALIICLSYLILAPIFINISTAFTYPRDVGLSSSIWIPSRVSTENWHVSMLVLNYKTALPYTLIQTGIIAILQTLCAMLAAYSFARLRFPGRGLLFACVVFTIIVPPQVF